MKTSGQVFNLGENRWPYVVSRIRILLAYAQGCALPAQGGIRLNCSPGLLAEVNTMWSKHQLENLGNQQSKSKLPSNRGLTMLDDSFAVIISELSIP